MKIRNPEKWIGKPINKMEYLHLRDYDKCDDCQCLWWADTNHGGNGRDGLHPFIWPQSDADYKLQKALGVEEAMSYCPSCLSQIEKEADAIDPGWRERQ